MINYSGHIFDTIDLGGYKNTSLDLQATCCGYQKLLTRDFSCTRENGRIDYQLVYVYSGKGMFKINNSFQYIEEGTLLLFNPKEPQIFRYFYKDKPEIFWIHFTGNDCDRILNEYHIHSAYLGHYAYVGKNITFKNLFIDIIKELQLKKAGFENIANNIFKNLLIYFSRNLSQNSLPYMKNDIFDKLILDLNKTYQNQWTLDKMASFCSLSTDYFSHTFKNIYKISPMQYLNSIRINKSKEFLFNHNLSISEVSYLTGYSDPLYFSRIFKKKEGISPNSFRAPH